MFGTVRDVLRHKGSQVHTIGPGASALDAGVPLAIHSDAPVTPLGPLFTAWCAVNRRSATGRVLGEGERIRVDAALRAVTLGAAYTLKLDHEIGSIEPGKRADFVVLEEDPTQVDPARLKDVKVWGTVQGGRVFQAAGQDDGLGEFVIRDYVRRRAS